MKDEIKLQTFSNEQNHFEWSIIFDCMIYCSLFILFLQISSCERKISQEWSSDIINELFKTSTVHHPTTIINQDDLERAKKNIEKYEWAKNIKNSIVNNANGVINRFKDDSFLDNMVPRTTPATETFCPNCAKLGGFHSKGTWSWSNSNPNIIKCTKCGMTFPNSKYPEELAFQSTFDPKQTITYINTGPQTCMKYFRCFSSIEGLIRGKKIEYTIKRISCLAQAYALTGDIKYGEATKRFLLKFADRMPNYLVYCAYSYNQYADCDPHYVVQNLPYLPKNDEKQCPMIVADPENAGDTFFSDYWSASRLGTSGTDGEYVQVFAEAYDLVADAKYEDGKPLFSAKEKEHVEKDLLIESSLLGFFNDKVDNKQTMNMKGCSLVGLVVGNPKLVRFGLNGFNRTLNEYFLKDGSSSQSQGYGMKTISGLDGFNLAFRNYSDPSDFKPGPNDVVYKNFNINKDTEFEPIWQSFLWAINPDWTFPIIGDQTFKHTFPGSYVEYLASEYKHQYLLEYVGVVQNEQSKPNNDALFLRDPDYVPYNGTVQFNDIVYPYLQQGFIRSGESGRDSILILDASPADGGHHHYDSLNVIYTKYDKELLLDLGYLVDHPNKSFTMATVAHQTVVIDGTDQYTNNRGGEFELFDTSINDTKVMQASSHPYHGSTVYQRTIVKIQHENRNDYVVDIFRANGGSKRRELVFHGPNNDYKLSKNMSFVEPYEITPADSYIEIRVRKQMTFDISDISLYDTNEDGTRGNELLRDIPSVPQTDKCTNESDFCYKVYKKTSAKYEVIDGPTKGKKAIRFTASNADLLIGHENSLLHLRENARYILQFKVRGSVFVDRVRLKYNGIEASYVKTSLNEIKPDEWTLFTGYFDLGKPFSEALGTKIDESFSVDWKIDENINFSIFVPSKVDQKVFFKNGWGQRYTDNRDFGTTLPYFFFYRDVNESISTWVTVYEGYKNGTDVVRGVEAEADLEGNVAIRIKTIDGYDYVSSSFNGSEVADHYGLKTDAKVAVINNGKPRLFDGNKLEFNGRKITSQLDKRSGYVIGYGLSDNKDQAWYDIDDSISDIKSIKKGQVLFVKGDDNVSRGYPILSVTDVTKTGHRIFVKYDYKGFKSYPASAYHIMNAESEFDSGKSKGKSGLSKGGIAAIVIIVIVVVAAAIVGVLFFLKKRKQSSNDLLNSTIE